MSIVRSTVGTALSGAAKGLNLASKLLEATSKTMRPGSLDAPETTSRTPQTPVEQAPVEEAITPPAGSDLAQTAAEVTQDVPEIGRVVEPDPTPLLDETPHVRTYESHIEELADKPAGQVVQAVTGLSTDELRLLTEYEMAHKNRRTVLGAIEKALAPDLATPNSAGDSSSGNGSGAKARTSAKAKKGQSREIILPDAGGVPTSGTMDPSKG